MRQNKANGTSEVQDRVNYAPYTEQVSTAKPDGLERDVHTDHARVVIYMWDDGKQNLSHSLNEAQREWRARRRVLHEC